MIDLKVGDRAKVIAVKAGSYYYRHKLFALGLIPGSKFQVTRIAPLGCPIEIILEQGLKITVRKQEVSILAVEKICNA